MAKMSSSSSITLDVKHGGKVHKLAFTFPSESSSGSDVTALKEAIYQITGVPSDRMKLMLKTGLVKESTDLRKSLSNNPLVTVIGSAGPLPQAPTEAPKFLEDMTDKELAIAAGGGAGGLHPGLVNLGNTCYMNASLQAMKTIPELRTALDSYQPTSSSSADPQARLTSSLKQMIKAMSETTESFPPLHFLATLRQVAPQFAEESRHGGYAQQDADEMWTQTISSLHSALQIPGDSTGASFVDKYLATDLQQTLTCDEAPEEPPVVKTDRVFKLDCNISINTNYLISGIMDSFDQKIEKYSPSLGRTAVYTQKSRLTRLPANLTIHMVRFYWRADIQKKAKIMRKVKFPLDLDVLDLLTDDLQAKVKPINLAVKNVDKARTERAKLRKRTKKLREDVEKAERAAKAKPNGAAMDTEGDEERVTDLATTTAENDKLEDEETIREKERKEIKALITENGLTEVGTNASALYELCAIVTHKGASADSGHYLGWTRMETGNGVPGEEDWYKFDDDKVSVVSKDKIMALEGGGEDSVAYILLYRSKTV